MELLFIHQAVTKKSHELSNSEAWMKDWCKNDHMLLPWNWRGTHLEFKICIALVLVSFASLGVFLRSRMHDLKSTFFKASSNNFHHKRICLSKLPEASSQALFADSQAHIWALEGKTTPWTSCHIRGLFINCHPHPSILCFPPAGLSYLIQASYSEDQFGVVQTTLPSILSCMLVLQEVGPSWVKPK